MKLNGKIIMRVLLVAALLAPAVMVACCSTSGCCTTGSSCCSSGSCCTSGSSCCNTCCDACNCSSCTNCCNCCNNCCYCDTGKTWFSQRDQGSQEWYVMSLTADKRHQFDREEFYGDFAVNLGWEQNFDNYRLSSYFFKNCGSITIGPNAPHGQTQTSDIRASDLGLSTTFTGTAWLCPKYANFIADFDLYLAWDEFVKGLWTELRVPFVHTRWNAGLGTSVTTAGGTKYASLDDQWQYFVTSAQPVTAVDVVYTGNCALSNALLGNLTFGNATALTAGKIRNCVRTANGLSGIRLALGYDFIRKERGSMGIAIDAIFPAANKPAKNNCCCDLFIFDANIGEQNAYKVGGVLRGQYRLWDKEDERIDLYLDGRVYGTFNGKTTRMLGLTANGTTAFNHYLLLEKYSTGTTYATYEGLERAANLLKAQVKAKAGVEGQATAMFQYKNGGFVGALGYNFYGRSAEQLCVCCMCNASDIANYYYVIKGDLPVGDHDRSEHGGFYGTNDTNIYTTGTMVPLSNATWAELLNATVTDNAINFTPSGNLTLCPATHPQYISNTIFGNLGYNWEDVDWKPYLGVLAKVDIGMKNTALRLWGVYLKGGICF